MLDLLGPLVAAWSISYLDMVLLGPGISFGLVFVFFDTISFGLDTGTFVNKMNHVDVSPHLCMSDSEAPFDHLVLLIA